MKKEIIFNQETNIFKNVLNEHECMMIDVKDEVITKTLSKVLKHFSKAFKILKGYDTVTIKLDEENMYKDIMDEITITFPDPSDSELCKDLMESMETRMGSDITLEDLLNGDFDYEIKVVDEDEMEELMSKINFNLMRVSTVVDDEPAILFELLVDDDFEFLNIVNIGSEFAYDLEDNVIVNNTFIEAESNAFIYMLSYIIGSVLYEHRLNRDKVINLCDIPRKCKK